MSKTADKKKRSTESTTPTSVKTGAIVVESEPTESKPSVSKTGEPNIRIDSDVTRRIRQHARAHLKTEVCGVLIGESSDGVIEIRASIEALNAAQAGTHVTFTQDAWEEIYKVKDDLYPDARIVGWYHSHPGFGIFLSEHDLFIQENFFSSPGQVAWVYDPHSDDEGCFGWVAGKVARLTSISTLYQSGDPVEHATKGQDSDGEAIDEESEDESYSHSSSRSARVPLWVVISRNVLTHLTVLLAGFAIAFFFFRPPLLAVFQEPSSGVVMVFDYHELVSYMRGTGPVPKPVDVVGAPVAIPGQPVPAPSPPPATSPSSALPSGPVPSATLAPFNAPAPVATPPPSPSTKSEPANPQPAKPGSHQ